MKKLSTDTIRRISGTGGAHGMWGMFGARGPLLAPEGEGGGSGATTTTDDGGGEGTTSEGSKPATAAPANDKKFTQADLDRIASKSRDEGRKAALKEKEQTGRSTTVDDDRPLTMKDLKAQLDSVKQRGAFDRRAAKLGLDDEAIDDLYVLYQANKPSDDDAWFSKKAALFTGKTNVQNTTNNTNNGTSSETAADPAKPAAIAPRAPQKVDPIAANGMLDIFSLSAEQIDQLGPTGLREKLEQVVAAGHARSGAPPLPKGMQKR